MAQIGMKFRVKDEAHSKAIQEKLFEMGYSWKRSGFIVSHTEKRFLYVDYWLTHGKCNSFFEEDENTEYVLTKDGNIVPLVDNEGYTYWEGGECPVSDNVVVDVKFNDGVIYPALRAKHWRWDSTNIVGYKLSTQPQTTLKNTQTIVEIKNQELPTLRLQKEMWLDRAAEIIAAISICIDRSQKVPDDWLVELKGINEHL